MNKLLEIKKLKVALALEDRKISIYPVDDISFSLEKGEITGIVGESGCGKTMVGLSIIKLLPRRIGRIAGGEIILNGENISHYSEQEIRKIRGKKVGMVFQDPLTALNPTLTIGRQICETIMTHKKVSKSEAHNMAIELLKKLEFPSPERTLKNYPYQLSGGMRQRIVIAISTACNPSLLICDEPTTALDVTIGRNILMVLRDLNEKMNITMIIISHDLDVIGELCKKVLIMYLGKIVEEASIKEIFKRPAHPYTQALFRCIPKIDDVSNKRLNNIKGNVPDFANLPIGCRFNPRCPYAKKKCKLEEPVLYNIDDTHKVACFYPINQKKVI